MAIVTIKFMPPQHSMVMFNNNATQHVREMLAGRVYTNSDEFIVEGEGRAAADEVFDLTNNPSRQEERERVYGKGRSLSVGDIVVVAGDMFLCKSFGWEQL